MKEKSSDSLEVSGPGVPMHTKIELFLVIGLIIIISTILLVNNGVLTRRTVVQYADQLRQAVLRGEVERVRQFFVTGSYDADSINEAGRTLLMDAVTAGHKHIVELLLQNLANPSVVLKDTGDSALLMAIRSHRVDIARVLLENGADVNTVGSSGDNVLMAAIRGGLSELVRLILPKTANLNQKDDKGNTALMLASEKGDLAVVMELLNMDVSLIPTNQRGETALALAVKGGYLDIAKALLDAGAQVGKALDTACDNYDKALMNLLLERGAMISDNALSRLIDKAKQLNDQDLLTLLQRFGIS